MLDLTRRNFLGSLLALPTFAVAPALVTRAAERFVEFDQTLQLQGGFLNSALFWYEPIDGSDLSQAQVVGEIGAMRDKSLIFRASIQPAGDFCFSPTITLGFSIAIPDSGLLLYTQRLPGLVGHVVAHVTIDGTPTIIGDIRPEFRF